MKLIKLVICILGMGLALRAMGQDQQGRKQGLLGRDKRSSLKPESKTQTNGQQETASIPGKALDPLVLESNRNELSQTATTGKTQLPDRVLKALDVSTETSAEIADESGDAALLNPLSGGTRRLSFLSATGELKWTRDVHLSRGMRSGTRISSDGRRVIVYGFGEESPSTLAIYDNEGTLLSGSREYLNMAPSGHYFYSTDQSYFSTALSLLDSRLKAVRLAPILSRPGGTTEVDRSYAVRILEKDILVMMTIDRRRDLDAARRQIIGEELLIYDLKSDREIARKDLMPPDGKRYNLSLSDGRIDAKGNTFVASLIESTSPGVILAFLDLTRGTWMELPNVRMSSIALSNDGSQALLSSSERQAGKFAFDLKYTVVSPAENGRPLAEFSRSTNGTVRSFMLDNKGMKVVERAGWGQRFTRYITGQTEAHSLVGWFSLKQRSGLVPLKNPAAASKVDIVKTRLEDPQ